MYRKLYLFTVLLLFIHTVFAQHDFNRLSNLRKKFIPTQSETQQIDTLSILPNSLIAINVSKSSYYLDEINATITWINKPSVDSVAVIYRVLPLKLNAFKQRLNYEDIRYNFYAEKPTVVSNSAKSSQLPLLDFGTLQTAGSIGRAISFGNSQDANVNSSLNLQLSGYIGDSLELTAAITDNNIPIQPDGNTQDLRDFDRIFLQIKKNNWQTSFGDLDIRSKKNYFLNFYKRLQGASFSTQNKINTNLSNSFNFTGSIAKGKFTRNFLTPVEGNQGPYRLQGANNELFFIVLAGTERVFIDGEMLQRGEDQDYVINYNTAEITFTPKWLINKDRRIQVEFEYADRNYLNAQFLASNEIRYKQIFTASISAFSNSDVRNSTIDQPLDVSQKQILANIGDSTQNAYVPSAVRDTFSAGKILYKKIDTLYNVNVRDSVFVQSVNPNDKLYSVSFIYKGPGKGNYRQILNSANGKVYGWIAPDANNNKQGEWDPVTFLVTPKKLQIVSAAFNFTPSSRFGIMSEIAMSNYDVNLFSNKDKSNDNAFAAKITMKYNSKPFFISSKKFQTEALGGFEFVENRFKPIERLRNVEFLRDWSLPFNLLPADEKISRLSFRVMDQISNDFKYEIINYKRSDGYNGFMHFLDQNFSKNSFSFNSKLSMLNFDADRQKGIFLRPSISAKKIFQNFSSIQFGAKYLGEFNKLNDKSNDTLTPTS
ncbi:MAG: hypothetical protein FGM46_07000, partial [Ferruginibacter sp.]|nr:hypothetical protein [Ferruginibacter sp.]